jgi:ribosomal protein S27AE
MIDAYVYTITNKLTGEFYHGYRYRNQTLGIVPKDDLWITYFTSSNRIKNDIKKYGKTAFTATIIYENSDSVKCWQQEQIAIRQDWGNTLLLNGKYHDPESSVEIFRRVNILTEESRQKMSAAGKGRPKSENHKKNIAIANTGKKGSAEKSAKISVARKGKSPSNKGITPPKYSCPNCGSSVSMGNLNRWHGKRCKMIDPIGHDNRSFQVTNLNKK